MCARFERKPANTLQFTKIFRVALDLWQAKSLVLERNSPFYSERAIQAYPPGHIKPSRVGKFLQFPRVGETSW